jgi:uncharacterized protein YecT (DUF1311 family)
VAVAVTLLVAASCDGSTACTSKASSPTAGSTTSAATSTTLAPPVPLDTTCESTAKTTVAIEACLSGERAQLDAAVAELNSKIKAALPAGRQSEVEAAQAAWDSYAQESCAMSTIVAEGGTIHGPVTLACLIEETENHVRDLQNALAGLRG